MHQGLLIDMPLDCQVVGLEEKMERDSVASSSLLVIVFIVVIIDIRFIFTILIVILQHGCRDETFQGIYGMIMTSWPPSRRSRCSSVLSSGFPIVASPNRCQSREQSLQPRWQSKQWLLTFWPVCREGPPTESWKQAPRIAAVEFAASSCFLMSWHPPPEPVDKIKRKSHCNKNAIKSKTETSIRVSTRQSKTRSRTNVVIHLIKIIHRAGQCHSMHFLIPAHP